MTNTLRDFLEIPYDKLEELNLAAKQARVDRTPVDKVREERQRYLFDTVDHSIVRAPAILVLHKERSDLEKFHRCFASIEPLAEIERPGPGAPAAVYGVWLANGAKGNILRRGCR